MHHFYYLTVDQCVVRVSASRRPSERSAPRPTRTWVMQEQLSTERGIFWCPTWEVTWSRLSKLTYIGRVKHA